MANHSFVTTRKHYNPDKVEQDLKNILVERFSGRIPYKRDGSHFDIGFEWPYSLSMWVENRHRLEFRNPRPDWAWWVQSVIHNEFALLYNGWISDEGVKEKWRGEVGKFPTYKSYMYARFEGHPLGIKVIEKMLFSLEKLPPEVQATINEP